MAALTTHGKIFHAFLNTSFLLLLCFVIYSLSSSPKHGFLASSSAAPQEDCSSLDGLADANTKCSYLKIQNPCVSQGYIDYLKVFYCLCNGSNILGYSILALWLIVLFYLLGNTASQYFCSSLECLSDAMGLSPTIAGVTLLSLGNGAPDVFSSIVSFTASGTSTGSGKVGLSSILGGAFFVSSVVVGIIGLCVPALQPPVHIDRSSFVRDIFFLLASLGALFVILVTGSVRLWEAICFASLYLLYILVVSVLHCHQRSYREEELRLPLCTTDESPSEESILIVKEVEVESLDVQFRGTCWLHWFLGVLELPLYLPRRLTIPVVSDERWSKPFAVASVIMAPLLLSLLYNARKVGDDDLNPDQNQSLVIYLIGGIVGTVLGIIAMETTETSCPPKKFLLPWLAGGFLMSVTWSYILAGELVALLVSLGYILSINPSTLGLTVLAWGNSIADLMTNVAMATNGGQVGAQIAISGCYAGPLFNTLVGLGISFGFSAWNVYPSPFVIPIDSSSFEIIGFLVAGLLWALVMLTKRGMILDKALGIGLVAIYMCFLCLRVSESMGLIEIDGFLRA